MTQIFRFLKSSPSIIFIVAGYVIFTGGIACGGYLSPGDHTIAGLVGHGLDVARVKHWFGGVCDIAHVIAKRFQGGR